MITAFETSAKRSPDRAFFTFVDENGAEALFSYRRTRFLAAAVARRLLSKGVRPGDCVAVDLPNCPEFVLLALAAAYGSFSLAILNHRHTSSEKLGRLLGLEGSGLRVALRIDESRAKTLIQNAQDDLEGIYAQMAGHRPITSARRDAEEEVTHFAERAAHLFDESARAIIMFTSGTTGKAKAVSHSWRSLMASAAASNASLSQPGRGLWQAVLPLYHIGGFQVLVRSVLNKTPLRLYARFDAKRVLADVALAGATHVPVVDKMLRDMLDVDPGGTLLSGYRCILLGGGVLNAGTVERAQRARAQVYASYGMTETASQVANASILGSPGRPFDGGLELLRGYRVRIVDPDEQGFGRLAVAGPSIFSNYLNAQAAFTVDGFFLTGDTAALIDGRLYVKERTSDMFVSGGENVYPAEIAGAIKRLGGVADAYVFGAPDSTWGRRPVAFVERDPRVSDSVSSDDLARGLAGELEGRLSKLHRPKHLFVLESFPRRGIGKVDRAALEALWQERIEVAQVVLHRVRLPFKKPFVTAKARLEARESIIIEVIDTQGRVGLGECVAFSTDWYLPETVEQDWVYISQVAAPLLIGKAFLHPREASAHFARLEQSARYPLAIGAVEPALWDLYGKIVHKPLWQLLDDEYRLMTAPRTAAGQGRCGAAGPIRAGQPAQVALAAGAVVGIASPAETVEAVGRCVAAGYRRVKLKVRPGSFEAVRQVREAFPRLLITLDANQSYSEYDLDELRAYDDLDIAWIEEPFDLAGSGGLISHGTFTRLASLQRTLATPICLDESFVNASEAAVALSHPELRCFAVKVAKFGGVENTLRFVAAARACKRELWMGGMYDSGISKRLHAAFQALDEIVMPGDIGSVSRYFATDVTEPPYSVERGMVTLNRAGHEDGLGCDLCAPALAAVEIDRAVVE